MLEAERRIATPLDDLDLGWACCTPTLRRASLALDLMKALHPQVDADVLHSLRSDTCTKRDFLTRQQRACHRLPPLVHRLAETAPLWTTAVAADAERITRALGPCSDGMAGRRSANGRYRPC